MIYQYEVDISKRHCLNTVHIWSYYGEILHISPYSVQMRENTDQNNSKYRKFLRSEIDLRLVKYPVYFHYYNMQNYFELLEAASMDS